MYYMLIAKRSHLCYTAVIFCDVIVTPHLSDTHFTCHTWWNDCSADLCECDVSLWGQSVMSCVVTTDISHCEWFICLMLYDAGHQNMKPDDTQREQCSMISSLFWVELLEYQGGRGRFLIMLRLCSWTPKICCNFMTFKAELWYICKRVQLIFSRRVEMTSYFVLYRAKM